MVVASKAKRGLHYGTLALAILVLLATAADPADARGRHRRSVKLAYQPPYAAIVVDANSGQVLHESSADSLRHPASLTKIMTLYLLFEQIEANRLSLDTPLPISEEASSQAPSKLGLRPGSSISVEDALKALVTKSANDAAVVIAEAIGGDEEAFAKMMTRKARALGMSRTVYRNASGLPDGEQVTTARDQALLGRAIQDRFPRFYRYFSVASFNYHGKALRNHNKLLGRVNGVDGIKTGYTNASGFNLVTSVRRGNRYLVAAVFGGRSAGSRDARMRDLIEQNIDEGATRRTAAKILDNQPPSETQTHIEEAFAPTPAQTEPVGAPTNILVASAGSFEPIQARRVKTLSVKPNTRQTPSLGAGLVGSASPQILVPEQGSTAFAAEISPPSRGHGFLPGPIASLDVSRPAPASAAVRGPAPNFPAARPTHRGGWLIQIGAFDEEGEAKQRLQSALSIAKGTLVTADPFTERVTKGAKTLYRARFAGFDKDRAEAACKQLKRNDFACLALKN